MPQQRSGKTLASSSQGYEFECSCCCCHWGSENSKNVFFILFFGTNYNKFQALYVCLSVWSTWHYISNLKIWPGTEAQWFQQSLHHPKVMSSSAAAVAVTDGEKPIKEQLKNFNLFSTKMNWMRIWPCLSVCQCGPINTTLSTSKFLHATAAQW